MAAAIHGHCMFTSFACAWSHHASDRQGQRQRQAGHGGAPATGGRSRSLLPAGEDEADGRYAVAEEASLDQQSDQARRVGSLPPDPAPQVDLAGAVAGTLAPDGTAQPPPADPKHATP
ncbi:hypothetical protein INH39_28615 [Massilia violaceinigra]|uniref:Uncharacterized protein n=1 Tax=Massilia violaceinigra TaxID=2045208 RepID=A0ABY4A3I0_9BURK|nr:hypothetical protein [Massilia violaceinigra]UOD29329.1 hypothetical protein INH39_28615 [Massilia violaceinigra]